MTQILTQFSEPELNAAFKRMQTADWRAPINRTIYESDPEEREKIRQAVEFYTATECVMKCLGGFRYWVTATGQPIRPRGALTRGDEAMPQASRAIEDMTSDAQLLNEAVLERDIAMVRSIIRGQNSKVATVFTILQSVFHIDRTADDRDWEWLLDEL